MSKQKYARFLMVILVIIATFSSPLLAATQIECGGKSVSYPGIPELSTLIELPAGFNGVSLDPPPARTDPKDGIAVTYQWEHVGTFATRSGTGSLTTSHWTGIAKSSSVTSGFGFSISASETVSAGVPDVDEVKVTMTEKFGYSEHVTKSMSGYEKEGLSQSFDLKQNTAVQVWRLALHAEEISTGVTYTVGTDNVISCEYPLDFKRPLYVMIWGNSYPMPEPPTDSGGRITHPDPPPPLQSKPKFVELYANKPEMQAYAFLHLKKAHAVYWHMNHVGAQQPDYVIAEWSDLHNNPLKKGGWKHCNLLGTGPANAVTGLPIYPYSDRSLGSRAFCNDTRVRHPSHSYSYCYNHLNKTGCKTTSEHFECGLQYTESQRSLFLRGVCKDWSIIAAGGRPTWMTRRPPSQVPLSFEASWNLASSADVAGPIDISIQYDRGVTSSTEQAKSFSSSIGIEVEGKASLDVVSVSGKLSSTFSTSGSRSWGLEVSENDTEDFELSFKQPTVYDAYTLAVEYMVGHRPGLKTTPNFVVVLDSGPSS